MCHGLYQVYPKEIYSQQFHCGYLGGLTVQNRVRQKSTLNTFSNRVSIWASLLVLLRIIVVQV